MNKLFRRREKSVSSPEDSTAENETLIGDTNQISEEEKTFRKAAEKLRDAIEQYNNVTEDGNCDQETIKQHEKNVYEKMKEAGNSTSDPRVKTFYEKQAERFLRAGTAARKIMANDVLKGLLIILAAPLALVAAVVVVTGGILYGVGSVVKGLGETLSGGFFSGSWQANSQPSRDESTDNTRMEPPKST